MSLVDAISSAGMGMTAQSVRLNTVASNLANLDVVSSSPQNAYHGREPIFKSLLINSSDGAQGVKVDKIATDNAPPKKIYDPGNPNADKSGYVYGSNVDRVSALTNMLSASQSYQADVSVANTCKELLMDTIDTMKG